MEPKHNHSLGFKLIKRQKLKWSSQNVYVCQHFGPTKTTYAEIIPIKIRAAIRGSDKRKEQVKSNMCMTAVSGELAGHRSVKWSELVQQQEYRQSEWILLKLQTLIISCQPLLEICMLHHQMGTGSGWHTLWMICLLKKEILGPKPEAIGWSDWVSITFRKLYSSIFRWRWRWRAILHQNKFTRVLECIDSSLISVSNSIRGIMWAIESITLRH